MDVTGGFLRAPMLTFIRLYFSVLIRNTSGPLSGIPLIITIWPLIPTSIGIWALTWAGEVRAGAWA